MATLTLGQRFINAYNLIDHSLRIQYNFKTSITFSDLIRRCAGLNQIIRVNETDLVELARLRNSIVHNRTERLIAEPHEDIVEFMERIANLISAPPLAVDVIKSVEVKTIRSDLMLRDFLIQSQKVGHSNIPVFNAKNEFIGVLRRDIVTQVLGSVLEKGGSLDAFVNKTTVEQYLREYPNTGHFCLVSSHVTIEEIHALFDNNRKLASVIVTENGTASTKLMGIITPSDLIDMKYWSKQNV